MALLDRLDEAVHVVDGADLVEHPDHGLVGATVAGPVQRGGGRRRGRVRIGVGRADDAHGRGAAVLLVVGVEDEQQVEGLGQRRVGVVARLGHLPHRRQEVGREAEAVVGVHEGHADAEAVGGGRQGGHLGDEPGDLLVADVGIEDVLGVLVERRQGGHRGDQHPHRVGVVVEALQEPLAHVLVDVGVIRDVVRPLVELVGGGQLAEDQQVGHLEVGGLLGELLDRVARGSAGCPCRRRSR